MKQFFSRILCLLLALSLIFCFAACSSKNDQKEKEEKTTQKSEKEEKEEEKEEEQEDEKKEETPAPAPEASVAGKYLLVEMTKDGTTMNRDVLVQAFAIQGMELDSVFYLELKEDGTAIFCVDSQAAEMKYEDGKLWTIEDPRDKVPFTLEDGKLTLEKDGDKLVFQTGPIASTPLATPSDTNIVGPYTLLSMNDGTNTYSGEILEMAIATQGLSSVDDLICIELKADGTGTLSSMGKETALTWDDTTIYNTEDSSKSLPYEFDAGYLTFSVENYTYVFIRK